MLAIVSSEVGNLPSDNEKVLGFLLILHYKFISSRWSFSILPDNIRKNLVLLCFKGV